MADDKTGTENKLYPAGAEIFQQGDPGGDLFFIKEGVVQVFTTRNHQEVHLTNLGEGEILGIMTCLNNAPRLASARAKSDVVCVKVPHEHIMKQVERLPNWMNVVIKEFSLRIQQINAKYAESMQSMERLRKNQLSKLFIACQVADCFANLGEYLAKDDQGRKIIYVDEMINKMVMILGREEAEIKQLVEIFIDEGLLKVEIEQERRRKLVELDRAKKLGWFAQFARQTKSGKGKKLMATKFLHKEQKLLFSVVEHAKRQKKDLFKVVKFTFEELTKVMPERYQTQFDAKVMQQASKLGLIALEIAGSRSIVSFVPSTLARSLLSISAIRRFENIDEQLAEDATQKPTAA